MPDAIIISGANGAGKTTFARQLLPSAYPAAVYLNADEISREHPDFALPFSAGREFMHRLAARVAADHDFALETTLASRMYARQMPDWRAKGYRLVLHFIEVPSADFAVQRVAQRVAAGGHDVPEPDIRRRYQRGLSLFTNIYRDLVDEWYYWRTGSEGLTFVEEGKRI